MDWGRSQGSNRPGTCLAASRALPPPRKFEPTRRGVKPMGEPQPSARAGGLHSTPHPATHYTMGATAGATQAEGNLGAPRPGVGRPRAPAHVSIGTVPRAPSGAQEALPPAQPGGLGTHGPGEAPYRAAQQPRRESAPDGSKEDAKPDAEVPSLNQTRTKRRSAPVRLGGLWTCRHGWLGHARHPGPRSRA